MTKNSKRNNKVGMKSVPKVLKTKTNVCGIMNKITLNNRVLGIPLCKEQGNKMITSKEIV